MRAGKARKPLSDGTSGPLKTIGLSVRDFALPCPRVGSIDSYSGYGKSSTEGMEIHQQVQRAREKEDDDYEPEVKISAEFTREEYRFVVEGRMDGLFRHDVPEIEEIKWRPTAT